jgi:two-component system, chemotaxis family, protein-glutamate methylesterase/glutaminase
MMSICKKETIKRLSSLDSDTNENPTIIPLDQRVTPTPLAQRFVAKKNAVNLLLIGSSTGGPQTLQEVFKQMRPKRNYGIVIVQHMPPVFTAQLANNLEKVTGHHFVEASEGLLIEKSMIVIAKGGQHLELIKEQGRWRCHLTNDAPVNSCRPSVDVTFNSAAAQINFPEVVSVMLTGMGADGAQGSKSLSEKGVAIITQEKGSCVVYGMPKAVDDLGITTSHAKPTFIIAEAEKYMLDPETA